MLVTGTSSTDLLFSNCCICRYHLPQPASPCFRCMARSLYMEGWTALHEEATGGSHRVLPIPRGRRPRAARVRPRRNDRAADWISGDVAGVHDGSVQEARCGGGGRGRGAGEPQGDKHVHGGRAGHTGGRQVVGEYRYIKRAFCRAVGMGRRPEASRHWFVCMQFW